MATRTIKKTVQPKTEVVEEAIVDSAVVEQEADTEPTGPSKEGVVAEEPKHYTLKELDPHMYITVRNGFNGVLVYKSKKTGERFVWESFGDEQDMELMELKSARNSSKDFFINNWFLFDDPQVIEWLGVSQYYKHALTVDGFDELFDKTPAEIKKIVSNLSNGQKSSVAFRARSKIKEGEIDSIKVINALEDALGVELIER